MASGCGFPASSMGIGEATGWLLIPPKRTTLLSHPIRTAGKARIRHMTRVTAGNSKSLICLDCTASPARSDCSVCNNISIYHMEGFALDEEHGTPGGTPDAEDTPSTTDSSGWDQPPTFVEPVYANPNPPEPDASTVD